jgi:hypothetical protein
LQLGKYEFYPYEERKSLEELFLSEDEETNADFLEWVKEFLAKKKTRKKKIGERKKIKSRSL